MKSLFTNQWSAISIVSIISFVGFSQWANAQKTIANAPLSSYEFDLPTKPLPPSQSPLFQSEEPLALSLKGDFDRIHKANAGGNWTGEDRTDPKYWTKFELKDLAHPERTLTGLARARGMSSATEGENSFPKLRVEIADTEKLGGTLFKESRKFRINTHPHTNPPPGKKHSEMGRLNDERSPFREGLAYEVAQALMLPSPMVRKARITYTDTTNAKSPGTFTRNALLIETDGKIAERYDGAEDNTFPSEESNGKMSVLLAARFYLFNVLIGNQDIGLKLKNESSVGTEKYRPLFNTTIFSLKSGELFPIVYDFDMSSFVSGWDAWTWKFYEYKEFGIVDGRIGRMLNGLASLRARLSKTEFLQSLSAVLSMETGVHKAIQKSVLDEEGRQVAYEHLDFFKQAAALVMKFQMLLKKDVQMFSDPKLTQNMLTPEDENPGTLHPGTLVQVLEIKGNTVKIAIVDTHEDLSKKMETYTYIGYIKKSDLVLGDDLPLELQGYLDIRDMAFVN